MRAIAVGEATASAARAAGFDVDVAGGTADRMITHILQEGHTGPLLHLRGEIAIGNVAQTLTEAGVETREAVIYRQRLEPLNAKTHAALSQDRPCLAPVFSPRTARQLRDESKGTRLTYAAISQAVADALDPEANMPVRIAKTPNRAGMVALVTEMIAEAVALERSAREM